MTLHQGRPLFSSNFNLQQCLQFLIASSWRKQKRNLMSGYLIDTVMCEKAKTGCNIDHTWPPFSGKKFFEGECIPDIKEIQKMFNMEPGKGFDGEQYPYAWRGAVVCFGLGLAIMVITDLFALLTICCRWECHKCFLSTTLQSLMNTKLSKHRFWHCHENGLIKTIPHNL